MKNRSKKPRSTNIDREKSLEEKTIIDKNENSHCQVDPLGEGVAGGDLSDAPTIGIVESGHELENEKVALIIGKFIICDIDNSNSHISPRQTLLLKNQLEKMIWPCDNQKVLHNSTMGDKDTSLDCTEITPEQNIDQVTNSLTRPKQLQIDYPDCDSISSKSVETVKEKIINQSNITNLTVEQEGEVSTPHDATPSGKVFCQTCKKEGHTTVGNLLICYLCGKSGHAPSTCLDNKSNTQTSNAQGSQSQSKEIHTCQVCNKKGHVADKCFKLFPHLKSIKAISNNTTITVCQICNTRGHTADKCYELFPSERRNKENIQISCYLCKSQGHWAENCPNRPEAVKQKATGQIQIPQGLQFQQTTDILCQICKKTGHGAYICPFRHNQIQHSSANKQTYAEAANNGTRPPLKCYNCNEVGHFSRDCPAKKEGNAQYRNSTGYAKGLSTTGVSEAASQNAHPVHTISIANTE